MSRTTISYMTTIQSAYDHFCEKRFPVRSEVQFLSLQQRIGLIFPSDYRRFILDFNGGYFDDPIITPGRPRMSDRVPR